MSLTLCRQCDALLLDVRELVAHRLAQVVQAVARAQPAGHEVAAVAVNCGISGGSGSQAGGQTMQQNSGEGLSLSG